MSADFLFGVLFNIALIFVIVSCSYGVGRRRARSQFSTVIKEMQQNADEILPIAGMLGGLMPVFTFGSWLAFGDPPKRLIKKFKVPVCGECKHILYAHRATFTILTTSETVIGELVPVSANMVCKAKGCHCVKNVTDGEFEVSDLRGPDSE